MEGYITCREAIVATDCYQLTVNLTLPVQLIEGGLGSSTPVDLMQISADLIKCTRFETIHSAGYLTCVEATGDYAEILIPFTKEINHI